MGNLNNCFLNIAISAKALELYGLLSFYLGYKDIVIFSFTVITDKIRHNPSTVRISYDQN